MVRINGADRSGRIASAKSSGKKSRSSSQSSTSSAGTVQVADAAALREKAKVMLADMHEVRMERIEELRSGIEKGTYKADSAKVAAHIIVNALSERAW
ncbi:MAG: flagellar biosynthesis anti-sigma factor FlgM [Mariprofundaceae bacterium]|nr:flagellar biosynthesis anti-sigma factor FlgM [Mariprofundaceae bacterium]